MTKRTRNILLVILAIVVLFVLLRLLYNRVSSSPTDTYNWKETYLSTSKEPYGTYILRNALENFGDRNITDVTGELKDELPIDSASTSNFIFVGESFYLDSTNVVHLLNYIEAGNNVLIIAKIIPYDLMFDVYYYECPLTPWRSSYSYIYDKNIQGELYHNDLHELRTDTFNYLSKFNARRYQWRYINSSYFCDMEEGFLDLGAFTVSDHPQDTFINFARINYAGYEYNDYEYDYQDYDEYSEEETASAGGIIFLHTNPILFTNIAMLDTMGRSYVEGVLSHLPQGDIYWDTYNLRSESFGTSYNNSRRRQRGENRLPTDSPLKYVMSETSLRWAWFSLLGMGLLFFMFRSKRRQRIIPVIPPVSNTSLEFITTIGALYQKSGNHKQIAMQMMEHLKIHIRERYQISTKNIDEAFFKQLNIKSEIPVKDIQSVFDEYSAIKNSPEVSTLTLHFFYDKISRFYK